MTTTFTSEQNEAIVTSLNGVKLANAAIERAQGKREGAYSVLTRIAGSMESEPFSEAMSDLIDRIRSNADGIAPKVGAKRGDKGGWKVPSSVSSAKSVLTGCHEYGVPFFDEEGEPVAFSQLRKDLASAKQAEADAERQPAEISRDEAIAAAKALIEALSEMDPDLDSLPMTDAITSALAGMTASVTGEDEAEAEADVAQAA